MVVISIILIINTLTYMVSTLPTQLPKVNKRPGRRAIGSLPPPPVQPVYHSPPINAFSLKDLEPKQDDELEFQQFENKQKLLQNSRSGYHNSIYGGGNGEERYFGNSYQFPTSVVPQQQQQQYHQIPTASVVPQQQQYQQFTTNFDEEEDEEYYKPSFGAVNNNEGEYYNKPSFGVVNNKPKELIETYPKGYQLKNSNIDIKSKGLFEEWTHEPNYEFSYQVIHHGDNGSPSSYHNKHDGKSEPQFFGHSEKREGDSTRGRYHVLLPDGRHQKVSYLADHQGYHAQVTYN